MSGHAVTHRNPQNGKLAVFDVALILQALSDSVSRLQRGLQGGARAAVNVGTSSGAWVAGKDIKE
jgi:hypothetical protein